jgi:hypothetical protein
MDRVSQIGAIMMKWSLEKNEYELALLLFNLGIGIPSKLLYNYVPVKKDFTVSDVMNMGSETVLSSSNSYLCELLNLFRRSVWTRLEEWNNSYGYRNRVLK